MNTLACLLFSLSMLAPAAEGPRVPVGVAKVDITPAEPIRLSGYGNRTAPSEGVAQPLYAKALAIGDDASGGPVVLVTVDNLGVPAAMVEEVRDRLNAKTGLPRERLAVAASHTHTGPCLTGVAPLLFGTPIPPDHQAVIDQYTRFLTDKIEEVALAALENRAEATLRWAQGSAPFAANRRVLKDGKWVGFGVTPGAPVQHALPVLVADALDGSPLAILVNYACHCTTLTGDSNQIHGDWAGWAQAEIEKAHPGAIALVSIGCGADANPEPRGTEPQSHDHGQTVAAEVQRLLAQPATDSGSPWTPLGPVTTARLKATTLAFDTLPTREELTANADKPGALGLHARVNLARLDSGEDLQKTLDYPLQAWLFGDALAMVFLPGEVVVDYDLRLREEHDGARLWINAYSNDAPCYIASRRLYDEGGYEVDGSMLFYDRPTRLAPDTEDRVIEGVNALLPPAFDRPHE